MAREIKIIAGANGAGKTTFAREYLNQHPYFVSINADDIAAFLTPSDPAASKIAAGKKFFEILRQANENGRSLLVETTLSGKYLRKWFSHWRRHGYRIHMIFIYVDSPEVLIERIKERVRKGGHHVPDVDIRRRYSRGIRNFTDIYKGLADAWHLYYNTEENFQLVASGEKDKEFVILEEIYRRFIDETKP